MPTWLNSQKKARLAELAEICQISTPEDLAEWRKDHLVPALEVVLSSNPDKFSKVPAFAEYYQRRNSPIKRGSSSQVHSLPPILQAQTQHLHQSPLQPLTHHLSPAASGVDPISTIRDRSRRTFEATKSESSNPEYEPSRAVVDVLAHKFPRSDDRSSHKSSHNNELLSPESLSTPAATTRARPLATTSATRVTARAPSVSATPARNSENVAFSGSAPLPPSPAIVTEMIETQTARFNAEVGEIWHSTRIMEFANQLRLEMSSMVGVHMAILALEFYFLQSHVTVWRYAFDVNTPFFTLALYYPDIFVYLTGHWLTMLFTWQALSFWAPLGAAWVCNLSLTLRSNKNGVEFWRPRYRVDPVTFSITKALLAWLVYDKGARVLGLFSDETVARVLNALPAGLQGVAISSAVGVIMALWDGLQSKK